MAIQIFEKETVAFYGSPYPHVILRLVSIEFKYKL